MKPIHIGTSPLTNRIFAGHVLKCGTAWADNKQDVTGAACGAVCEHVMAKGGTVEVTLNGKPKFEITVRDVEVAVKQPAQSIPDVCAWREDESVWHSACGGAVWQFADEGPIENGMKFCLACGKPLVLATPEANP